MHGSSQGIVPGMAFGGKDLFLSCRLALKSLEIGEFTILLLSLRLEFCVHLKKYLTVLILLW